MMSSLMGVRLGHVLDGLMVNVIANNEKLCRRAEEIVMQVTGCDRSTASSNLHKANGAVKEAVLLALGAESYFDAQALLERNNKPETLWQRYSWIEPTLLLFCQIPLFLRSRGSRLSRSASPNRLKPNERNKIARPEKIAGQGFNRRKFRPSESICPSDGVGGCAPRPKKDNDASTRIAAERSKLACTRITDERLGSRCLNTIAV